MCASHIFTWRASWFKKLKNPTGVRMKKIALILATLALLSACETMDGLGRDTQKLGQSISKAAD
jgi:predicted small secreted protein